jgi:hypothetical protein
MMEFKRIPILGLDYRTKDHEAIPGLCRQLNNLYPAGSRESMAWSPMPAPVSLLASATKHRIRGAYLWNRANMPSQLLTLELNDDTGKDTICAYPVDQQGSVGQTPTQLYVFPDTSDDRRISWAQTGDNLVVSAAIGNVLDRMLVLQVVDSETVCLDFNPNIAYPRITFDFTVASDKNAALTFATVYFGIRVAYELVDGGYLGISPVFCFPVTKTAGDLHNQWPKLTIKGGPVTFDAAWQKLVSGMVVYLSPYVSDQEPSPQAEAIVRDKLFHRIGVIEGMFAGTGSVTFDEDWDTIPTLETLEIDQVLSSKQMRAPTLFSYNKRIMYAGAEYRFLPPSRLDGLTQTDSGGGTIGVVPPPPEAFIWNTELDPSSLNSANPPVVIGPAAGDKSVVRFSAINNLSWVAPDLTGLGLTYQKTVIQRRVSYVFKRLVRQYSPYAVEFDWQNEVLAPGWVTISDGVASPAVTYTDNYYLDWTLDWRDVTWFSGAFPNFIRHEDKVENIENIRVEYRALAHYTNGLESVYVVATHRDRIIAPVTNIVLADWLNPGETSNPTDDDRKITVSWHAKLTWTNPSIGQTALAIENIYVERGWQYIVADLAGIQVGSPRIFSSYRIAVLSADQQEVLDDASTEQILEPGQSTRNVIVSYRIGVKFRDVDEISWAQFTAQNQSKP